jgi:methylmalonyl-CoA mutase, N-terminal domain
MDETLALPTEEAVTVALRTQQIIAEESGAVNSIDPLGGSYVVESLTKRMEKMSLDYIRKIDELGGIIEAVDIGFPQREIADASYKYQRQLDSGQKVIVGVNKYEVEENMAFPTLNIDDEVENEQRKRLTAKKENRNNRAVRKHLRAIAGAAKKGENLMPFIVEAVREYATVGEISDIFRDVYGVYRDPGYF